ncbi:PRC-barrel domain-containing protein [Sphingomonas sp. ST-64]|uniref:PRC-barrel domain-containing protein n=1 Tax=Sphingomonas plantiphila TaxID=3163295 RepID=A0ABW8YLK2_9SPHN
MTRLCLMLPVTLAAAACSDATPEPPPGTEIAANGIASASQPIGTPRALPTASGPGTAFGLTRQQLEDAELVDTVGREVGEVERVETDASGDVTAAIVEVADTDPDRLVRLPITRLTAVANGDGWDLRAMTSRAELIAMPQMER